MVDLVLGLGQGGSRIAFEFSIQYKVPAHYFNLAEVDFRSFNVPKREIFLIDLGGTGRDASVGEAAVRMHFSALDKRLCKLTDGVKRVAICVGGGGGSGVGFLFPILEWFKDRKLEVLVLYTLPQKMEGLPAKPEALRALNRLIKGYVGGGRKKCSQIAPILIDNDFCRERYGHLRDEYESEYWLLTNLGIVKALYRFWVLTSVSTVGDKYDPTAGYSALDVQEFLKILFFKEGFVDIREMVFDTPKLSDFRKTFASSSLVFPDMDIKSTKGYIVSIAIPDKYKKRPGTSDFIQQVFDAVSKVTKTPYVLRSAYFTSLLSNTVRVTMLLSGLNKSRGLEKMLKQTVSDVQHFKEKGDVSTLDLSDIRY